MTKEFNVTGLCFPEDHYMADVSKKVAQTYKMIEKGDYFIINRPRQYGKTTTLYTLTQQLMESSEYIVFNMSFGGIGDAVFKEEKTFSQGFVTLLAKYARVYAPELEGFLIENVSKTESLQILESLITEMVNRTPKKVVMLIDEVDKSSNNQLFVSFLAMLRDKYLERKTFKTFHSVVLAGVHDVKSFSVGIHSEKLKLRPDEEKKYNSPWNIATVYKVDMNLYPDEIKPMLEEYAHDYGVKMDTDVIAERLFYYTSGYPYLVSRLCKMIAEDILPSKNTKEWTLSDVNKAVQLIIRESDDANFDTLIKNLINNPDLYQLVYNIVIEGERMDYRLDNPTVNFGKIHGIFAESESGGIIIQNRIYRERIANMMISQWHTSLLSQTQPTIDTSLFDFRSPYKLPNNALNMENVLLNFQNFMKQQYSDKDRHFLERDGRLIFLAFLRPIINGAGYDFKEPQISEERRLDVVITYHQHQYLAELKIWYGQAAHEKGLIQLTDYLDRLGLSVGYLVIFDHSKRKSWKKDWIDVEGKRIFWVRV